MTHDLLFGDRPVAARGKEGTGGNGSVRLDRTALDRAFQRVAKCCCDALPLETGMDIQTVEVAVTADVAKADDLPILLGNPGRVLQKRAVPGRKIDHPIRPRVALVGRVVPAVHRVHGIVKEGGERRAVVRVIGAQLHIFDTSFPENRQMRKGCTARRILSRENWEKRGKYSILTARRGRCA